MPQDLNILISTLSHIKSYLPDIVIVGGWVPILYKSYSNIYNKPASVHTKDIDVLCPRKIPLRDDKTIDELLTAEGFTNLMYGEDPPPMTKYIKAPDFEIEFLTPLKGREQVIGCRIHRQRSLTAQSLRYMDILLEHTTSLIIHDANMIIRVPELPAFVFQKGLSFPERSTRAKKDKDLYYIYDVIDNFSKNNFLVDELGKTIFPSYHPKWSLRFIDNLRKEFTSPGSTGVDGIFKQIDTPLSNKTDADVLKMKIYTTMNIFIEKVNERK